MCFPTKFSRVNVISPVDPLFLSFSFRFSPPQFGLFGSAFFPPPHLSPVKYSELIIPPPNHTAWVQDNGLSTIALHKRMSTQPVICVPVSRIRRMSKIRGRPLWSINKNNQCRLGGYCTNLYQFGSVYVMFTLQNRLLRPNIRFAVYNRQDPGTNRAIVSAICTPRDGKVTRLTDHWCYLVIRTMNKRWRFWRCTVIYLNGRGDKGTKKSNIVIRIMVITLATAASEKAYLSKPRLLT